MSESSSTLTGFSEGVTRRRLGYGLTTALLVVLMGATVAGAFTETSGFGVKSDSIRDHGEGLTLDVTYGAVSRPGLATPFDIEVTSETGFDGPVRVAVDRGYLRLWDENGLLPSPSSETVMGHWLVWELDPPTGATLTVSFDGRIEPAAQSGRTGAVAVLDADDTFLADVQFTTRLWP